MTLQNVEILRHFTDKKFSSAGSEPHESKQKMAADGGSGAAAGRADAVMVDDRRMLTPQMRYHMQENASKLLPNELIDLRRFALKLCPSSVEDVEGVNETKV